MVSPDKDLEIAFEKLLVETDLLLTQRQKMWIAFKTGAEWAMKQVEANALKKPNNVPYYERSSS